MPRSLSLIALLLLSPAAFAWPPRLDKHGDPLPQGAVARLGTVRWRHTTAIHHLFWSADGKSVWSHGQEGLFRHWDAATGKELARHALGQGCFQARRSADGKLLAALRPDALTLLDPTTGAMRVLKLSGGRSYCFALSPDGKSFVAGEVTGESGEWNPLHLRDLTTGKVLWSAAAAPSGVSSVAFSPDGKTVVSGGCDGGVRMFDAATGKERHCHRGEAGHRQHVYSLAVSADGKTLATGAEDVSVRDAATGKPIRRFGGPSQSVPCVGLSPDGKRLATLSHERRLKMWDTKSGKELWSLPIQSPTAGVGLAFSPDGKTLAAADGSPTLGLFQVETGKRLNPSDGHTASPGQLAFSPDGKTLATAGHDSVVLLWDVAERRVVRRIDHKWAIQGVVFSPDGKTLAVAENGLASSTIVLRDVTTGKERKRLEVGGTPSMGWGVGALAFSADGKTIQGQTSYGVQVWDVATGQVAKVASEKAQKFVSRALSPDGRLAVGVESEGHDRMWTQASSGAGIRPGTRFPIRERATVIDPQSGIALARFELGTHLLVQAELWQARGRAHDLEFTPPLQLAMSNWYGSPAEFSPDGRLLLTRATEGPRVHELASGKQLWARKGDAPHRATFTADGRSVLVCTPDGKVTLLEAGSGELVGEVTVAVGYPQVALSPDLRVLATGHPDTSIVLWDVATLARPREAAKPVEKKDFDKVWADLGSEEPPTAYRAIERLAVSPGAVAFLKEQLRTGAARTEDRVGQLLKDLDSRQFAVREKAMDELKKLGAAARPALVALLADRPSLEARRRVELILNEGELPDRLIPSGEPLRRYRAIQALERMAEAR